MRYGAIEVLASNSVHGNLLAHIVRVPMQSDNSLQYSPAAGSQQGKRDKHGENDGQQLAAHPPGIL